MTREPREPRDWSAIRHDPWGQLLLVVILTAVLLGLTACTTYVEPLPPPRPNEAYVKELEKFKAEVAQPKRQYADVDRSAATLLSCQQLGFPRGSDAERLCLLRGFDRYVDHQTPPLSERYLTRQDEISVQVPRSQPPVVQTPPAPSSGLVDCRIDPRPPCRMPQDPVPERWQYGGQASPPDRP